MKSKQISSSLQPRCWRNHYIKQDVKSIYCFCATGQTTDVSTTRLNWLGGVPTPTEAVYWTWNYECVNEGFHNKTTYEPTAPLVTGTLMTASAASVPAFTFSAFSCAFWTKRRARARSSCIQIVVDTYTVMETREKFTSRTLRSPVAFTREAIGIVTKDSRISIEGSAKAAGRSKASEKIERISIFAKSGRDCEGWWRKQTTDYR